MAITTSLGAYLQDNVFLVSIAFFALFFIPSWIRLLTGGIQRKKVFLDPQQWQQLPLVEKKSVSHNTRWFRFALPQKEQLLGLPIGQHITLKAEAAEGGDVMRPYTPVSDDDQPGFVDFVIKVYPQGRMSQHMDAMKLGEALWFKGPKGRFTYQRGMKRAIGMIAGGTGITPMYQVANAILRDPQDRTEVSLIFANVAADDILLKAELDLMAKLHSNFRVYYVLNDPPEGWTGGVGFVTSAMIKEHLPPPADDIIVCRCGPLPMNKAMEAHLEALGYAKDSLFVF